MVSILAKVIEVGSRLVVARGREEKEMMSCSSRGIKLQLCKMKKF